jgi:hypothetical protein
MNLTNPVYCRRGPVVPLCGNFISMLSILSRKSVTVLTFETLHSYEVIVAPVSFLVRDNRAVINHREL